MIYIGIDPDVDKSGFAVWDSRLNVFTKILDYRIFGILAEIDSYNSIYSDMIVIVEAGWLNKKSNFHSNARQSKAVGEKIALSVGANQQVGKIIVEYCQNRKITVLEQKPLAKKWGEKRDSKINASEFEKLSGWSGITNPEKRDAAMMVIGR